MTPTPANTPGQPPLPSTLVDISRLITAYYSLQPDTSVPAQRVSFGTSGHRGSAFSASFNDTHIAAITQAIVEYRADESITGPLYLAKDTHALSEPAFATALEVLAANNIVILVVDQLAYTPTPALSHAILTYNRGARSISPMASSSPSPTPKDGGFKYSPPNGGPADTYRHQVDREPSQRAHHQ